MDDKDYKFSLILSSVAVGIAIASFGAIPFIGVNAILPALSVMFGGGLILSPGIYFGLKKINERQWNDMHKHFKASDITLQMLYESFEKDRTIGKTTTNFLFEIKQTKEEFQLSIDDQSECFLNDFLYLINANYFSNIVKNIDNYSRERLVKQILNQTGLYLRENSIEHLTNKDIKNILSYCYFIPDVVKKEIIQEYCDTEVRFGNYITHAIDNRGTNISDAVSYHVEHKKEQTLVPFFDMEKREHYQLIIQSLEHDEYLSQFGDVNALDWDIDSLQQMLMIIMKDYREELIKSIDSYSNFHLACSFIDNAACYAVVNGKDKVGTKEMIATFRDWQYVPFSLRSDIVWNVMEKMNLEEEHPFYQKPTKKKAKIISFNRLKNDENK